LDNIILNPIGKVISPYKEPVNVPIQSRFASDSKAQIIIFDEFKSGIKDIELFSHIYILFYFHLAKEYKLQTVPFLDDVERGVFATRAPRRPNHIGLSIVKLEKVLGNVLEISNCDILDQTPVLDIKPYNPRFDSFTEASTGWYNPDKEKEKGTKSDRRFT